jgi:hypothetical protein
MLRKIRVMHSNALGRGGFGARQNRGGVKPTWNKGLKVIIDTHGRMPSPQEFHLNMVCKLQDFQLITP